MTGMSKEALIACGTGKSLRIIVDMVWFRQEREAGSS